MKVTLIHGQNHRGCSFHMGRLLAEQVADSDEIQEFFLPRDLNHFCVGCMRCLEKQENCPFYQEKKRILQAMEASELLIFTTPTYCMRCSAPMKAFLDLTFTNWMVHRPEASMFRKKAAVISAAAGAGTDGAIKDVKNALFYWGIPKVYSYGAAVHASGWEQIDEKTMQKIKGHLSALAKKIQNGKEPRVGVKTRFMFFAFAMMQKNGWGASPEEKEYWQKQGWLDHKRPWKD